MKKYNCKLFLFTAMIAPVVMLMLSHTSVYANADDFSSEAELVKEVESLRERASDPILIVKQAEPLILKSQRENWQRGFLYASSYKLESLMFQENSREAKDLYIEILPLAEALEDELILIRLGLVNLKLRFMMGNTDSISELYDLLRARVLVTDNPRLIGEVFLGIGNNQENMLDTSNAIKSYQKAYQAFQSIKNDQLLTSVITALGNVYQDIGDIPLAVDYYEQALDLMRDKEDEYGESIIRYNIGKAYILNKQYALAEPFMRQALALSAKIDDYIGVALANLYIAEVLNNQERWQEALVLFEESEKVFVEVGDVRSRYYAAIGQVTAHRALGQAALAQAKLSEAETLNGFIDEPSITLAYHDLKASISAEESNYRSAFYHLQKSLHLQTTLFEQQREQESQRYKVQFDTKLTQQQNEILVKENAIKSLEIIQQRKQERIWNIIIVLASIFFLITVVFLILQIRIRNKFKALAFKDFLTDSPNRRAVLDYAEKQFELAKLTYSPFSIAIVDLDFFKRINDSFGHDTGDNVLISFAKACRNTLRGQDDFGRYGGEEWLIVFTNATHEHIQGIFFRLRAALNHQSITGLPEGYEVTFSMGVAEFDPKNTRKLQSMIDEADKNLYVAKNQGRDRVFTSGKH